MFMLAAVSLVMIPLALGLREEARRGAGRRAARKAAREALQEAFGHAASGC